MCQLHASECCVKWRKAFYVPRVGCLQPFAPWNPQPCKIRWIAKTIWAEKIWSQTRYLWGVHCTAGWRAPVPFSRCCHSWHIEETMSLGHGSHDPCIVLPVYSQSAILLHKDRMPLDPCRIWAISKKTFLAWPVDLHPASARACNSHWHFISSLVTLFIMYCHNINNDDEAIIKLKAI